MIKTFPIDFLREAFRFTLAKNRKSTNLFDDEEIKLFSFYEHLVTEDEVNRYVETYQELCNQQNRTDLIGNGILVVTDNPEITNIKRSFISNFEWSCTIRVQLGNRDSMLQTIYELINQLKGKKCDIAQFESGRLRMVGTCGNNVGTPYIHNYDYIGSVSNATLNSDVEELITNFQSKGIGLPLILSGEKYYFYVTDLDDGNCLKIVEMDKQLGSYVCRLLDQDEVDYEYEPFEKFKLDLSFSDLKCDEPYTLNASEYCEITFGGSATLCDKSVLVGNDLIAIGLKRYSLIKSNPITYEDDYTYLEALEIPTEMNLSSQVNYLRSGNFLPSTHNESNPITRQYSVIVDYSIPLLEKIYEYARYNEQSEYVSPNMIYKLCEIENVWGECKLHEMKVKIFGNIPVAPADNDTMSMQLSLSVEG